MANTSAVLVTGPAQAVSSTKGRFFANQTFHFETLRAMGYITRRRRRYERGPGDGEAY
jgi:hypothetical protein